MTQNGRKGLKERNNFLEGKVEILAYKKGILFFHDVQWNLLLSQGLAEVIRTLVVSSPSTKPRIITRMAVGDQGTIPSDSTVPKVPTKDLPGLYHEFCRRDVDSSTPTLFSQVGFSYTGNTIINTNTITGLSSTVGITQGMIVQGTGIPTGTVVSNPTLSPTSIQMSNNATSSNSSISISFLGTTNQCEFVATFNAVDIPLTSFSNPSSPSLNEVGLVIIDPTASAGLSRPPVYAPAAPPSDEVVLSLRTFQSVPFEAANDISVTVRYTIFTE
jgi:hypothetical protein